MIKKYRWSLGFLTMALVGGVVLDIAGPCFLGGILLAVGAVAAIFTAFVTHIYD